MDHILKLDDLLYESFLDDEFEIISAFAIAKERLENERGSISRHGSGRRRKAIFYNSLQGEENILRDYLTASPIYPPKKFRRRFRMRRELFLHIHDAIVDHEPYFVQRRNVARTAEDDCPN